MHAPIFDCTELLDGFVAFNVTGIDLVNDWERN
jgi:hypothetical protein